MNEKINTESGERLSFYKLLKLKKYRIQIPIIQRDFAQGRKTSKDVRDNFLQALYKYLDENKPNRDLDFIYGSLSEINGETIFIPLDGQQRLTTLFLLHWYLYQISDNDEKKKEFKITLLKDGISMFTYETRSSSSEFCNALMSNDIDFNNLLISEKKSEGESKENSLSKSIKNSAWFYLSWQYDPTIQSILNMLDAIHIKFANKKIFFERLLDIENPIITFLFLNLKDFRLTDDLYIKMNSRGKPLTPFENFKAKLEQCLEDVESNRQFKLLFKENGNEIEKEVSLKEYFSSNIDIKWANLFWNYRGLQNRSKTKSDNTFDNELMNFIRVTFTNKYASNIDLSSKEKDENLEYLLGTAVAKKENKDYSDIISYHKYKELGVLFDKEEEEKFLKLIEKATDEETKEELKKKKENLKNNSIDCVLYLINSLDCLTNGNEKIKVNLNDDFKFYYNEQKAFENALKHDFESNHQRLCFHAYVHFLIYNNNNLYGINQWMRVIHNLTHPDNTIIDDAYKVSAAIKAIENLIPHSHDILNYLRINPEISFFSSWQILEEKIKAHLILKDENWEAEIKKIEKHGYFNGQIGFILEFAGILNYYNTYKNCDWEIQENTIFFTKFKDYSDKANISFEVSYENRKNNKDFIFERAVLTKGDYLTSASQNRKNLLSTNLVKNNIKRDHSWKRLLRIINEKEWEEKRSFVKDLFDDKRFDIGLFENSLKSICNKDKTNTWRDYFIDCPSLIEYCKQGFIRFENEHYILLYGESQSNFYHVEMYTYFLWKTYIENHKSCYEPFGKIIYNEVKSIEDNAHILFNNFCYNRIYYQLQIYYYNNNLTNPFIIVFRKSKGDNLPEKYGPEVTKVLDSLKFFWSVEYSGYLYTTSKIDDVLEKLKEVTENLKKLVDQK